MWGCDFFVECLDDLLAHQRVEDVIVINNAVDRTPQYLPTSRKLRMISQRDNIGVNPAWNLGVQIASSDRVCILNDDVVFDHKVFSRVDSVLSETSGVIGICPGVAEFNQPPFETGLVRILPWGGQHTYGFGCLMFVHRSWYIPIPKGLNIYYGDNWIFDTCMARGRTNYIITDSFFYTPFAVTSRHLQDVEGIHSVEQPLYRAAFDQFMLDVEAL